jgi:hypothetical protein
VREGRRGGSFDRVITRRRWLAGWGLLAGTYLSLAAKELLAGADIGSAVVYLVGAAITFGFAAAVMPVVVPRLPPEGGDPPPDHAGEDPEPPWWPGFERGFWRHVADKDRPRSDRPRERSPA